MLRRPHHQRAACTDATLRPRREHRRTICCISRSAQSPENHTAHRWATLPDTSAPGQCFPLPLIPLMPRAAILRVLSSPESGVSAQVYSPYGIIPTMKSFLRQTSLLVRICSLFFAFLLITPTAVPAQESRVGHCSLLPRRQAHYSEPREFCATATERVKTPRCYRSKEGIRP